MNIYPCRVSGCQERGVETLSPVSNFILLGERTAGRGAGVGEWGDERIFILFTRVMG